MNLINVLLLLIFTVISLTCFFSTILLLSHCRDGDTPDEPREVMLGDMGHNKIKINIIKNIFNLTMPHREGTLYYNYYILVIYVIFIYNIQRG